jgi:ABC-2 type transport system permease protein
MQSVHTGAVATDLLKPMSYFRFWLAQDVGRALAQLLLRGISMMALYALLFRITTPSGLGQWLALTAALLLAWLVSFCWRFLINLAAFWSPNPLGIVRFGFILCWFLSGFLMPLRYFPEWFVRLCYLTPFPHTVNTITEVYLGVLTGHDLILALAWQAVWAAALALAGQLLLRAGVKRLVILGG